MPVTARIAELKRRHEALEQKIEEALAHPSVDDLEISKLKRRKLQLKDEIAQVGGSSSLH